MTIELEAGANLFKANNHSVYKISYRKTGGGVQKALAALVADAYGARVVDPGAIAQVQESEQASNNFRVELDRGDGRGPRPYLLRRHILLSQESDLAFIENTLTFLRCQGVPVPTLVPTAEGRRHFVHDGAFWQLYEYLPGDHYRGTAGEFAAVAQTVAALHKALATFPYTEELKQRRPVLQPTSAETLAAVLREAGKRRRDDIDALFIANADLLKQMCDATLSALDGQHLRLQAVHGDLHPHNTICDPISGQCTIIDFDMMQCVELLRDVAYAAHRFVRQYVVWHNGGVDEARQGLALFLKTYELENPLTGSEKKLLPVLMRDELLRRITTDFSRYYFEGIERFATAEELKKKLTLLEEAEYISYE